MKKPVVKKAQMGKSVKPSADSTEYFKNQYEKWRKSAKEVKGDDFVSNSIKSNLLKGALKNYDASTRQKKKGKPGYDEHGYSTFKPKSPSQQISEGMKTKKKNGGIIKAKKNNHDRQEKLDR